jgi:hypothetical protein
VLVWKKKKFKKCTYSYGMVSSSGEQFNNILFLFLLLLLILGQSKPAPTSAT